MCKKGNRVGDRKGIYDKNLEMMNDLKGFGGKIYACSTAIAFHNIEINDLEETVDEITGTLSFLEKTDGAIMLYI